MAILRSQKSAPDGGAEGLPRTWQARYRRTVIIVWLAVAAAAAPFAARVSTHLTGGGFNAPHSASARVTSAIDQGYPGITPAPLGIVLSPTGAARAGDTLAAIHSVQQAISRDAGVSLPRAAERQAAADARARPRDPVVLQLRSRLDDQQAIDAASRLRRQFGVSGSRAGLLEGGRVSVGVIGQGALWAAMQDLSAKAATQSELKGFPVIAIVLFLVFGCIGATLLPLILGAGAVAVTSAILFGVSLITEISIFASDVTAMIGIGVAVDYSLFVLVRYREAMAQGAGHHEAIAVALRTSGRAVFFSGLTVVLSLLTVYRIDDAALRSLALGAIVVVTVAVLAAATLLPALMAVLGPRWLRPGRVHGYLTRRARRRPAGSPDPAGSAFWERWATAVMRRPVPCLIGSVGILALLAIPALHLNMRSNAESQLPATDAAVVSARTAARVLGPGAASPVQVLVTYPRGAASAAQRRALVGAVQTILAASPEVAATSRPISSSDGRSSVIEATLKVDPESVQAHNTVRALRTALGRIRAGSGQVLVGGNTASLVDFDHLVASSILWMFGLILVLAYAVLFVLLRSVILPIKAICMNLLSVGASYGALVAVFQWGWLGFLHLPQAPSIDTIVPPLVLVVAFGLSMDYEVFLLTRIRERYKQTGDTAEAVRHALARSATPISSAALIMVAVFLAFVTSGMPTIQRLGFALAIAIALDATVVRLVLVPAAMTVLGRWNWWLPEPVGRALPRQPKHRAV